MEEGDVEYVKKFLKEQGCSWKESYANTRIGYDVFYNKHGCEFRVYNFFDQYGKRREGIWNDDFRIEYESSTPKYCYDQCFHLDDPEDPNSIEQVYKELEELWKKEQKEIMGKTLT